MEYSKNIVDGVEAALFDEFQDDSFDQELYSLGERIEQELYKRTSDGNSLEAGVLTELQDDDSFDQELYNLGEKIEKELYKRSSDDNTPPPPAKRVKVSASAASDPDNYQHGGADTSSSAAAITPISNQITNESVILTILATTMLWPTFHRGFFCGDESLMFPYHDDTVTVPMLRIVGLGLPTLTFLICEWALLRKKRDDQHCFGVRIPAWLRGFYCSLVSFCVGVCFVEISTNFAKNIIGRPRPHFFDICQPSIDCSLPSWQGRYIQSHVYHCTGARTDKFKDMRMSFLSGHSAWAAYTMVYFALYIEKRMVWRGTRILRHTLQFAAIMMSWFTALSRVSDFKHHWSDVMAGYFLGFALAVLMFTYGTDLIKDKSDHTPLPQHERTLGSCQLTAASA